MTEIIIDAEHGTWDHYLPQEEWDQVVAEAELILTERVAAETEAGGAELQPLGLTPRRVRFPDTHGKNSGNILRQQLWVIHSAECPLRVGFAESLTKWANGGYEPRASWQTFIDPATVVSWIANGKAAFLHGPANSLGKGYELSGYARFTRAEWLTPDGLRQMDLLAQEIVRDGIPAAAIQFLPTMTTQAVRDRKDATTKGLASHAQIDPKNRTDPGKGFPWDVLISFIRAYHPGVTTSTPPGTPGTVRIGDRGDQVTALQTMLAALGYNTGVPDGVAGVKFDTAARAYQRDQGLTVDGVVGANTTTRLEADMATLQEISDKLDKMPGAVWSAQVGAGETRRTISTAVVRGETYGAANLAAIASLETAVKALATGQGLDPDAFVELAHRAAKHALRDVLLEGVGGEAS